VNSRRLPGGSARINIHPSAWLIAPTIALLSGQALGAAPLHLGLGPGATFAIPLLLLFPRRARRWAILLALCLAAFWLGLLRHRQLLEPIFADNHLRSVMSRTEDRLYLEGKLRHEPEKLVGRTRWHIAAERIWRPAGAEEISGDLLVTVRSVRRDWRYGDQIRFWIRPGVAQDSGNPGGFDYGTYLKRRGIDAIGFLESDREIELLARRPEAVRAFIEDLRREIRRFIARHIAGESGALLMALVIGDMGGITKETRAAFTSAGVNHVLSISGLHVAMLGLVVFVLIRYGAQYSTVLMLRLNLLKIAALGSFITVVFYTALAGAMVPTVRSAIMIGVYQLAVLLDREEEVFASLTLAALLIALVWPGVIADISFQLSFLAVLFIVWGMRQYHLWLSGDARDQLPQERSRARTWLRRGSVHLAVPLFATLGTGPLIAHYFGHISLAGFAANPVIVPLIGFVIVPLGLVIGSCALVAPELGAAIAIAAEYLLALTSWLVAALASLPLASIGVPAPNGVEIALLYSLLIGIFVLKKRIQRVAAAAIGACLLIGVGFFWWNERYNRQELRVTHLNVGQGDAAVVELPGSKVMLIDAGGTAGGEFDTGEAIVAPYLRSRKISKVDYLVVTHPRIDHYGGMRAIVDEFSPAEFWSGTARGLTARFDDLDDALERAKIRRVSLDAGQPCRVIDQAKICVLYPIAGRAEESSAVLRLEFGELRYLFASDIDKRDELYLQRAGAIRSAVLKVPRHGSPTASSADFVAAAAPRLAIVSAGGRRRNEADREDVLDRYRAGGAEVLRTAEDGAVIIESDGKRVRFAGYKSGRRGEFELSGRSGVQRGENVAKN
jgi:competence protein ComEC